jgi:predicted N-acetyltransferase YhbS
MVTPPMGNTIDGLTLLIREEAVLPEDERAACDQLWDRTWPTPPGEDPDPDFQPSRFLRLLLTDSEGRVIGATALIDRTISVDGEPYRIAGLQGVVVEEAYRGWGYGAHLVRTATTQAKARGYAFALLFTEPWNQPFYERLGWHLLEGQIVQQRHGQDLVVAPDRDLTLALPLTPEATALLPRWRSARVHVGIGQW